jgi:hypothetical protein
MKNLPVGIQSFEIIINENYAYVDKTELLYQMITKGRVYFISRPRRFGKSLLISTLDAIFQNKKNLFKDLWIGKSDYGWQEYPVIWLDMSSLNNKSSEQLERDIKTQLYKISQQYNIPLTDHTSLEIYFATLIENLSTINKVVVLIDEYDKPILDQINNPEIAIANREILKSFYGILKAQDANLKFVFLTGVSKFSKVSVFSGLNNLDDLTMAPGYATLLGITEKELVFYFKEHIQKLSEKENLSHAEMLDKIRFWYNGYRFSKDPSRAYNPFSTLLLLKHLDFSTYWFESATPTFLIKLIQKKHFDVTNIEEIRVGESAFSANDIDALDVIPMLFQTGYLTIASFDPATRLYQLKYPNFEVENSFLSALLNRFAQVPAGVGDGYLQDLIQSLRTQNFEYFFLYLQRFFANIPYELHIPQESYYQNIFYLIFTLLGILIQVEVHTNFGRMDAVVTLDSSIFIFEFKFNKTAKEAIKQIKEKKYAEKYQGLGKAIYLIGVNISQKERNINEWEVEKL